VPYNYPQGLKIGEQDNSIENRTKHRESRLQARPGHWPGSAHDQNLVLDYRHRSLKENGFQPEFTPTTVVLGLAIGSLICFTNLSVGLQSGWISMYVSINAQYIF
jgi:hypothetical protein